MATNATASIYDTITNQIIAALERGTGDYANELVGQCLEFWADDRNLVTYIRKAASRLDELAYGPLVPD